MWNPFKKKSKVTENHVIVVPEELSDNKLPPMGTQERWAYHRKLRDYHQGELDRSRDALRVQAGR